MLSDPKISAPDVFVIIDWDDPAQDTKCYLQVLSVYSNECADFEERRDCFMQEKKFLEKYCKELIILLLIVVFYTIGILLFLFGIQSGTGIAIKLAKPAGEIAWTTSETQMLLTTGGICMLGGVWIITSHVLILILAAKTLFSKKNI